MRPTQTYLRSRVLVVLWEQQLVGLQGGPSVPLERLQEVPVWLDHQTSHPSAVDHWRTRLQALVLE
jgi:hypothetical protein